MKKRRDTLESIPGVGRVIAGDLRAMGIHAPSDLRGRDPEKLYRQLCLYQGVIIDRCTLYVLRCAVYFVSNTRHDPKKLQWWSWKD